MCREELLDSVSYSVIGRLMKMLGLVVEVVLIERLDNGVFSLVVFLG
jgi:hypothetical protein